MNYAINFSISYNIEYLTTQNTTDFRKFLYTNSIESKAPYFIQNNFENASYIASGTVENYLANNFMTNQTPTIFILDTFSFDPVGHKPYYYNTSSVDIDSGRNPRASGSTYQIAGGGENNR